MEIETEKTKLTPTGYAKYYVAHLMAERAITISK